MLRVTQVRCVAPCAQVLGEGPCWDARAGRLYWVDIEGRRLEWLDPEGGAAGGWDLDRRTSALAPRAGGGLLLATEHGFALFDPATGTLDHRHNPEPERPWNRSNDGKTDALGRFWAGTMDDGKVRRSGAVYRLDPDWRCTRVLDGLAIPNTVSWSPDGRTFYLADSGERTLYACDPDERGGLGVPRPFARTERDDITPDGSAVDAEGFLWNAQWGGWRVVRYAPDGTIDRVVAMPVQQPTSCAFGGDDLSTLYVTSARQGLSEQALAGQPLAGGVFAFEPGARGLALAPFGG